LEEKAEKTEKAEKAEKAEKDGVVVTLLGCA
jgi:hypothetical protein